MDTAVEKVDLAQPQDLYVKYKMLQKQAEFLDTQEDYLKDEIKVRSPRWGEKHFVLGAELTSWLADFFSPLLNSPYRLYFDMCALCFVVLIRAPRILEAQYCLND